MTFLLRLACAAACLAAPAHAETLRFAHFVAPTHTLTEAIITPLSDALSDSDLDLRIYPAGELGAGPADQYLRAVQGVADIVWGLQGYTSSQFPLSMLTEYPAALPDDMSGADFLWNGWDAGVITAEYPATIPLALWTAEPAVLITRGVAVRSPADMAGLKIRVSGAVTSELVTALGASPVQMAAGDVYNALQTGLVDGVIIGASGLSDFRYDEVIDHVTLGIPLGRQSFFVVANAAKIAALPAAERDALTGAAGRALSRHAEAAWNAKAEAALAALPAGAVITLTSDETALFADRLLPVTEQAVANLGADDALAILRGQK